jgi:putative hydrolase of the HAD superfamily
MGAMAGRSAVIFDLDDTLYYERDYVRSGYRAVAEHLRETLGRGGAMDEWLWDRFCRGESAGAFDALNEAFSLGLDGRGVEKLVAVYRTHRPDIVPIHGVGRLLDDLGSRAELGVVSDGYLPAQQYKLEALGLGERFGAVVFTERLGREFWKPSPAGFARVADALDVRPVDCTYVGDNPAKDFLAPNRLGWRTVQLLLAGQVHSLRPAPPGGEPLHVVRSIAELASRLLDRS